MSTPELRIVCVEVGRPQKTKVIMPYIGKQCSMHQHEHEQAVVNLMKLRDKLKPRISPNKINPIAKNNTLKASTM